MAYINIRNKKGTSGNTPADGSSSWLEFWENKKGKKATICEVRGCYGNPDVGGHVIKDGQGSKEYILPMSYGCNNKDESHVFEAWESDLVPVRG